LKTAIVCLPFDPGLALLMTPAKLPAELLKPKTRFVSDLAIGESGYVSLRAFTVTDELDCFLDVQLPLEAPGVLQLKVRRKEDGFHVILPREPKYEPETRPQGESIVPIASITVAPEKWSPAVGEKP
jgi:hypothetical protein